MNIFLGGSRAESSSFIYTLSGNQFRIVSGMLANRPSLPEVELRVYNRMIASDPK